MKQTAIPASTLATLAKSATDGRREERNAGRNGNARSIGDAQEAASFTVCGKHADFDKVRRTIVNDAASAVSNEILKALTE